MATPSWRFEWQDGTPQVLEDRYFGSWLELFQRSEETQVFQHPELARAWLETRGTALGLAAQFCLATSAAGDRILLPLVRRPRAARSLWQKRLESLGEPNFDYRDPLIVPSGASPPDLASFWAAFADELTRRCVDGCWLRRLTARASPPDATSDSAVASPLVRLAPMRDWESFAGTLSQNLRGDVNRRKRRLAERGTVDLHVIGSADEAELQLSRMIDSHERRWRGTGSATLFREPGAEPFYRAMLLRLLPIGVLHFSCLRVDGEPIAWHFGFLWQGVLHWYKPVYDDTHASLSPGKVMLALLLQRGLEEGWRRLDLGAGMEAYKLAWANEDVPLFQADWRRSGPRNAVRSLAATLRSERR
jgi:CelD/BcsL family acetyltransferase involved in cellulose biosynthesis